jgi:integrase
MPIFLTVEQIHNLLEIARRSSPRDYALLRLMANTGLRESDVLGLKRKQLLTSSGGIVRNITVRMKKTGRTIEKTLSDSTRAAIAEYVRIAPKSPYLFPGEDASKAMHRSTVHRIYKRLLATLLGDQVALHRSSAHTLRRSTAFAISERQGVESASIFLGHASLQCTLVYLNRSRLQQRADEALKEMDL